MGVFRFILAGLVVLFHFGGLPWLVGRIAVFAFYCISGFLIFQVLDRVYLQAPGGTRRFLLNRCMRLGPLYAVYTALTLAFVFQRWMSSRASASACFNSAARRSDDSSRSARWFT